MFFSKKSHINVSELQQQLAKLQQENEELKVQNKELQEASEGHHQQEEAECAMHAIYEHWFSGEALINQVRECLGNDAGALAKEQVALEESVTIFAETKTSVNDILERVAQIQTKASEGKEEINSLLGVTEEIEKFVSVIRDISDQTNLLALNAAIEAARAGDAGRGFAVVADEVRTLASKANEASDEIATLVNQISTQTSTTCKDIEKMDALSLEVVSSAESISDRVSSAVELSNHMKSIITVAASNSFIQVAKLDHIKWKNGIYDAIVNPSHMDIDHVVDHEHCRLGHWFYEGTGHESYISCPSFKSLEAPHALVHTGGVNALKAIKDDNIPEAEKHLVAMEQASMDVARVLDRINEEYLQ